MPECRFRHTPACVWSLGLQLVWCPKYRRRVLGGRLARRLDELVGRIAGEYGWRIVAGEVMPDHVHLFVRVGPADAPASVVREFKRRAVRVLRQELPYLRNHVKVLWLPSYFAASVGYVSPTMVCGCIVHRWETVGAS